MCCYHHTRATPGQLEKFEDIYALTCFAVKIAASQLYLSAQNAELLLVQEFPRLSKTGLSLLNGLLTYDPDKRLTAQQALKHDYFKEGPVPKLPQEMPAFPSAHDVNDNQHKK